MLTHPSVRVSIQTNKQTNITFSIERFWFGGEALMTRVICTGCNPRKLKFSRNAYAHEKKKKRKLCSSLVCNSVSTVDLHSNKTLKELKVYNKAKSSGLRGFHKQRLQDFGIF